MKEYKYVCLYHLCRYIYVRTYACMYICVYLLCIFINVDMYVNIYMCKCLRVYMYECVFL